MRVLNPDLKATFVPSISRYMIMWNFTYVNNEDSSKIFDEKGNIQHTDHHSIFITFLESEVSQICRTEITYVKLKLEKYFLFTWENLEKIFMDEKTYSRMFLVKTKSKGLFGAIFKISRSNCVWKTHSCTFLLSLSLILMLQN